MKNLNTSVLIRTNVIIMLLAVVFSSVFAKENVGKKKQANNLKSVAAGCTPSTAKEELSVNNVRTTILINGDMWWNAMALEGPQYEIPKGSQKHSLFAGALWIGGVDASHQLKVAAQTYRMGTTGAPNSGNDFWPGPLDMTNPSITPEECNAYNRHWHITYAEVKDFVEHHNDAGYIMPEVIKNWPGNGDYRSSQDIPNLINPNFTHFLAPYHDEDGDGNYDPESSGDYPLFDLSATQTFCIDDMLFGDEAIWWVFNDMGNIHTETGGNPIGLEIQAQAFAFAKSDEINNMTFYHYKIINRSSIQVDSNYFGVWVDADLGKYDDDYVGCDVPRGLGYCYNGDAEDEGPTGYGFNPPAVGVDFFRGPKADPNDGIDNDRDCEIDDSLETELIIMSKFVYYNNDNDPVNGNPNTAQDYYNYLRGIWKNGQPMTYGGNGTNGTIPCSFMFPGNTDHQWEWGTGGDCATNSPAPPQPDWDEYIAGNIVEDRRFLQSAGPFTLKPGAVNYITTGAVWARSSQGGPQASVSLLQSADDKAQALFENCFKVLNGPDAPDVTIRELNNELILSIGNSGASNNDKENYKERDPYITYTDGRPDTSFYRFQGYQIFQVFDQTVTASNVHDLDKARLVAQVDIKDQVGQIVNYYFDLGLSAFVPVEEVYGADKGIEHSFKITTDAFASGDNRLINHKNYFFMAVAYGFNSDESSGGINISGGQKQPYIAGRRNVKIYTGIPHNPSPENNGQVLNSSYGSGPQITRVEGTGNGYVLDYTPRATLDLTSESVNQILSAATGYKAMLPTYVGGRGPIDVKVYDPVKVPNAKFRLWFDTVANSAHWYLKNLTTGDTVISETDINVPNEQLFSKWGLSVNIAQVPVPFIDGRTPGFIEATMTFADPTKQWLTGVSDVDIDGTHPLDWITSTANFPNQPGDTDRTQTYEQVLDGTWAPYMLCNTSPEGPASSASGWLPKENFIQKLPSIDVVFTPDKSKWTKCVVLETSNEPILVGVPKLSIKNRPSLDVDGNPVTDGDMGRSYFPGYAINVETGERLNIMFGEDSWKVGENGNDMKWNPTSNMFTPFGQSLLGGKHFIYIVNTNHSASTSGNFNPFFLMNGYDGCDTIKRLLSTGAIVNQRRVSKNICWVGFPLLVPGKQLLSTEAKVRLRVARPYASFPSGNIVEDGQLVPGQVYAVHEGRITHSSVVYNAFDHFTAVNPNFTVVPVSGFNVGKVMTTENKGYPVYTFSTEGLTASTNNVAAAKNALDLINVVPNPYYAYSAYEGTLVAGVAVQPQLDNRIRIVNLPSKCTISIYTVNGTLVKRFNRDVAADNSLGSQVGGDDEGSSTGKNFETAQDWDLRNHKNVPVSSGLYLIHVEAPGLGERTLKWFGVMRPVDLDAF